MYWNQYYSELGWREVFRIHWLGSQLGQIGSDEAPESLSPLHCLASRFLVTWRLENFCFQSAAVLHTKGLWESKGAGHKIRQNDQLRKCWLSPGGLRWSLTGDAVAGCWHPGTYAGVWCLAHVLSVRALDTEWRLSCERTDCPDSVCGPGRRAWVRARAGQPQPLVCRLSAHTGFTDISPDCEPAAARRRAENTQDTASIAHWVNMHKLLFCPSTNNFFKAIPVKSSSLIRTVRSSHYSTLLESEANAAEFYE